MSRHGKDQKKEEARKPRFKVPRGARPEPPASPNEDLIELFRALESEYEIAGGTIRPAEKAYEEAYGQWKTFVNRRRGAAPPLDPRELWDRVEAYERQAYPPPRRKRKTQPHPPELEALVNADLDLVPEHLLLLSLLKLCCEKCRVPCTADLYAVCNRYAKRHTGAVGSHHYGDVFRSALELRHGGQTQPHGAFELAVPWIAKPKDRLRLYDLPYYGFAELSEAYSQFESFIFRLREEFDGVIPDKFDNTSESLRREYGRRDERRVPSGARLRDLDSYLAEKIEKLQEIRRIAFKPVKQAERRNQPRLKRKNPRVPVFARIAVLVHYFGISRSEALQTALRMLNRKGHRSYSVYTANLSEFWKDVLST